MLGLKGQDRSFTIHSVNSSSTFHGHKVGLRIRSLDSSDRVNIEQSWSVSKLPISLRGLPNNRDVNTWSHLAGVKIPTISSNEVIVLIGSDTLEAFWLLEERRGEREEPYAIRSILGWTIQGPVKKHVNSRVAQVHFQQSGKDLLQEQSHKMWNAEFNDCSSAGKTLSMEDKRALHIREETGGRSLYGGPSLERQGVVQEVEATN